MSHSKMQAVEQKVMAFRGKTRNSGEPEIEKTVKRSIELITGGQVTDPEEPSQKKMLGFGDNRADYMERAKFGEYVYNEKKPYTYFDDPSLVKKFGDSCEILARLGYDSDLNVWMVLIKKSNQGYQPSVIKILFKEIGEVIDYLKTTLLDIDTAIKAKEPIFKYETDNFPNTMQFWLHDDVFYTQTMSLRIRFIQRRPRIYQAFVNLPNDNSKFQDKGYFGPKICLSRPEVGQLINALEEIKGEVDETKM